MDVDLRSDSEVRRGMSSSICWYLIAFLSFSNSKLEFLMKGVEVDHEMLGGHGRKITFRMDVEIRIVSLICKERRYVRCCTWSIVVGEFCKG